MWPFKKRDTFVLDSNPNQQKITLNFLFEQFKALFSKDKFSKSESIYESSVKEHETTKTRFSHITREHLEQIASEHLNDSYVDYPYFNKGKKLPLKQRNNSPYDFDTESKIEDDLE